MPVAKPAHARKPLKPAINRLNVCFALLLLGAALYSITAAAQIAGGTSNAAPPKIQLAPADASKAAAAAAEATAAKAAAEAARIAAELERAAIAREQCNKRSVAIEECRKIEGWKGETCEKGAIAKYDFCLAPVAKPPAAPAATPAAALTTKPAVK